MPQTEIPSNGMGRMLARAALLPVLILIFFLIARGLGLGVGLGEMRIWMEAHGRTGALVFMSLYVLTAVAALPGLPLTLASGALFGTAVGIVLTSIGSALGSVAAFILARYLARDAVRHWLDKRKAFRLVERWTAEQGALVVALTRLFPIFPYNLLNFAFGVTSVGFWTYLFWSWLCMLPGSLFYISGMDALTQILAEGRVPWFLLILAAGILLVLLSFLPWARREFAKSKRRHGENGED